MRAKAIAVALVAVRFFASAQSAFEFHELGARADIEAAKAVSSIDLFSTGTNLWKGGVESLADGVRTRAALDKAVYRSGEPIHLFVFLLNESRMSVQIPKAPLWDLLRVTVLDDADRQIDFTPLGAWLNARPAAGIGGSEFLHPNRILMIHLELSELAMLTRPGNYTIVTKTACFPFPVTLPMISGTQLPAIRFRILDESFYMPATRPKSDIAEIYESAVLKAQVRGAPLTDEEQKLVDMNRAQSEAARLEAERIPAAEPLRTRADSADRNHADQTGIGSERAPVAGEDASSRGTMRPDTRDSHPSRGRTVGLSILALIVVFVTGLGIRRATR